MVDLVEVPLRAVGGFFQMSAQTLRAVFSRPFQRQEFIDQAWFVARVSMVPTVLRLPPVTWLQSTLVSTKSSIRKAKTKAATLPAALPEPTEKSA